MRETSSRRLELLDEFVGVRRDQDVAHSILGDARLPHSRTSRRLRRGAAALERDPPVIRLGRGRGSEQRSGIRTVVAVVVIVRVVTVHLRRRALDVGERRLAEPDPGRQQTRFLLGEPSPGRFVVAEREPDRGGGHALAALVAAKEPRGYPVQEILWKRGRARVGGRRSADARWHPFFERGFRRGRRDRGEASPRPRDATATRRPADATP